MYNTGLKLVPLLVYSSPLGSRPAMQTEESANLATNSTTMACTDAIAAHPTEFRSVCKRARCVFCPTCWLTTLERVAEMGFTQK